MLNICCCYDSNRDYNIIVINSNSRNKISGLLVKIQSLSRTKIMKIFSSDDVMISQLMFFFFFVTNLQLIISSNKNA